MRRAIISALFLCISSAWAAEGAGPLELAPDAPDRHIVVPGDTLWGIASAFLKDPYRWPELWRLNPDQIKNPHRIYPGQVVILDRSHGDPQLKLGRLVKAEPRIYLADEKQEIPAIPQQAIEPFLSQPLVIDAGGLNDAPRVIATVESRVYVGAGETFYVKDVKQKAKLWQVYRPGDELKDPDNGEVLGHEAIYIGSAHLVAEGQPATFRAATSKQEIGQGDHLVPASRPDVANYVPHRPGKDVKGRVIAIYGGVGEGSRHSIVSLSRGKKDGLEIGHVLALYRDGAEVTNRFEVDKPETHKLPNERYGLVFVFRVFERVSYALVMDTNRPLAPGDVVRTP
ncbi:MAG: LysM peptidoglycan-binding domain-containing protein [Candidatus Nitricoxidivorans perseverans]|uniref:LysM peptidoglycan-binding domain-containing protein n=1 Tax=Candidatus Nitricoxidivorans perseverans TaxID=2975601 RepID=A0AA49IU35_9PROT|nr:MAG: LysM peptidoglycan-binding domain-containing protein [Candidatus Nitricoxidivorans perseverans]